MTTRFATALELETCLPKVRKPLLRPVHVPALIASSSLEIEASFNSDTWDEKDVALTTDAKFRITRTRTERTFTGGMNGKGVTEYTFVYHPKETSGDAGEEGEAKPDPHSNASGMVTYNGLMHFKGSVEGIEGEGEVAFEVEGTWAKDGVMSALGKWKTIPGTGTGGLKGLSATGGYESTGKVTPCWIEISGGRV